ncbi:TBC1 domain family member 17, partial [Fragariocoptes setiger]
MESPNDQLGEDSNEYRPVNMNVNPNRYDRKPRLPTPTTSSFGDFPQQLKCQSKDGSYLSQFYNKPVVTTLNSFSQVANLVKNPYELLNNADEFVRQHSVRHTHPTPNESGRESAELSRDSDNEKSDDQDPEVVVQTGRGKRLTKVTERRLPENPIPPPALPRIECSNKQRRLSPLTLHEYVNDLQDGANHEDLVTRVFRGSIGSDVLRRVLWPVILDIVEHRDRIELIDGEFVVKPNEANQVRWKELEEKFRVYYNQWRSILPEQESRFSAFRDRKSMIERDIVRCDRKHSFYKSDHGNLDILNEMLMTYMMYDFDIGYVQGMSDLAAPILYVYQGDIVRSFWTFVAVMKLFRRNFEMSQKTFKRELMKEDEEDYSNVLLLWDTIWCVQSLTNINKQRREEESKNLAKKMKEHLLSNAHQREESSRLDENSKEDQLRKDELNMDDCDRDQQKQATAAAKESSSNFSPVKSTTPPELKFQQCFYASFDPNQADIPRFELTDTEKFVLALCLSLIRRERDTIMAHNLDSTEILQYFINPRLNEDLSNFIEHATNIYSYLKSDFDINRLLSDEETTIAPIVNDDGYDLLNDYLVINNASI